MYSFFKNKKILITAGPTREYLDPVRYITNESSGKMGFAIAESLHQSGVEIRMVCGPVNLKTALPENKISSVITGNEMLFECQKYFTESEIVIFCAAVADYRPMEMANQKIKKDDSKLSIEFIKNPDIAFEFGKIKRPDQISIGFALETQNQIENAKSKMIKKNFDMIVLNSPNKNEGFGYDTNRITLISKNGTIHEIPLKTKKELANDIIHFASKI